MATHSSILAGKIPLTEQPGSLQSIGSQRVGHNWSNWACVRYMNSSLQPYYLECTQSHQIDEFQIFSPICRLFLSFLDSLLTPKILKSWWNLIDLFFFSFVTSYFALIYKCARMVSCFSRVWLFETLWVISNQAPLSMGFSRQEYWSWLSCPTLGIFTTQGWI